MKIIANIKLNINNNTKRYFFMIWIFIVYECFVIAKIHKKYEILFEFWNSHFFFKFTFLKYHHISKYQVTIFILP